MRSESHLFRSGLISALTQSRLQVGAVAGAQLSNYATFLVEPEQAPLAIVLTALSTGAGIVLTPLLALLMMGKSIPIDAGAMALSIAQIVVIPVGVGESLRDQSSCDESLLISHLRGVISAFVSVQVSHCGFGM